MTDETCRHDKRIDSECPECIESIKAGFDRPPAKFCARCDTLTPHSPMDLCDGCRHIVRLEERLAEMTAHRDEWRLCANEGHSDPDWSLEWEGADGT